MKESMPIFWFWIGPALLMTFLWVREFVINRNEPQNPNDGFSPRIAMTLWILTSLFMWPLATASYLVMQYAAHGGFQGGSGLPGGEFENW